MTAFPWAAPMNPTKVFNHKTLTKKNHHPNLMLNKKVSLQLQREKSKTKRYKCKIILAMLVLLNARPSFSTKSNTNPGLRFKRGLAYPIGNGRFCNSGGTA